jgi:hypothetical protein
MISTNNFEYGNKTLYGIKNDIVQYIWTGYFIFVFASSLIGDTIILIASIKYRAFKLHGVIIVIIKHIAICDLMVSTMDVLPKLISLVVREWALGDFACALNMYARYYFNLAGVLLICTMTTGKFLLMKYPLRLGGTTSKKAHKFCAGCWLTALIAPANFIILNSPEDIYFSYRSYQCEYGFSSEISYKLNLLIVAIFVFVPSCLVVASTIYLLILADQVARRGGEILKWRGIMTTVLTALVFCISLLPYVVYQVGKSIIKVDDESESFFHTEYRRIALSIVYLNIISNFYIYSLTSQSFRHFIWSRIHQSCQFNTTSITSTNHGKIQVYFLIFPRATYISGWTGVIPEPSAMPLESFPV